MGYNDVFKEQLVKKSNNMTVTIKKVGLILIGVIVLMVTMIVPVIANLGLFPVLFVVVVWVEILLLKRFNIEYEYIFTNGELDIDRIYNQSKRKHALSIDVRSFVVMINANNPSLASELGNINETIDFSSRIQNENTYAAVYERDGKRIKLVFEPNDTLIEAIKTYIPRKVKK